MLHQLVIDSPDFRKVINLNKNYYSIGRHPNNSIVILSHHLSRRHATIVKRKANNGEESFYIIDGDSKENRSTNGIWVNGKRQIKHELKHGDIVIFSDEIKATYQIVQNPSSLDLENGERELANSNFLKAENYSDIFSTKFVKIDKDTKPGESELVKFASFVELSPNPIIELNWDGEITYLNSAASRKFGNLFAARLEHPLFADLLIYPHHKNGSLLIREVKVGKNYFEQHIHYLAEDKVIRNYIFDVTQRKIAEKKLKFRAFYDSLTGLPNRDLFNEKLSRAIAQAKKEDNLLSVMFLDLDSFKKINDSLGHGTGDEVLRHFGQRLKSNVRKEDLIARWGGDEFIIMLPYLESLEEVKLVAQRILESLKQPFHICGQQLYLKTSIGIAVYPQSGETPENLIKNADAALYRTKELGRSNYQFYSPIITSENSEQLRLENLLHRALENEEFLLHYQPQINIKTGEIYGVEALLRWVHPKLGLVPPEKFISLAEQSGLIIPIGEWVLKTACQQNKLWQKAGLPPLRMGVNISAQQFQQTDLVKLLTNILAETELDSHWLEVEITETTLMQNVNLARQTLEQLCELGIHISMDDFGTGYSSLGYLKKFPFHTLKIDQSFVKDLNENPEDIAIISAVVALGHGFNLKIIAEGVETQQQLDLLRELQCEVMQGYWFSPPLPVEEVTNFINKHYEKSRMLCLAR
jgi:diguanylate cyclase (GGDEF)-like protein